MGLVSDTALARTVPEIDLIVGGHKHAVLHHPMLIGTQGLLCDSLLTGDGKHRIPGCLVLQAGARGFYLGVLSLLVRAGDIVSASGELLRNDGSAALPDTALANYIESLEESFTQTLDDTIALLTEPLYNYPYGEETSMGRWVTDAFRIRTGVDLAFQNPGGLRKTIDAGRITARDIWEACPFGNSLVIFELTGAEVQQVVDHLADEPREPLLVSGLTVRLDRREKRGIDLKISGMPVDPDIKYRAVTISYIIGHFKEYLGLELGNRYIYDTGILDRDLLIEAARSDSLIVPPVDRRITRND